MPETRIRTKLCLHSLHGQERKSLLLLWLSLLQSALTPSYSGLLMQRAARQVLDCFFYALFSFHWHSETYHTKYIINLAMLEDVALLIHSVLVVLGKAENPFP